MQPQESTPYRASQSPEPFTLQSDERDAILATGKWMVIAGTVGLIAALIELPQLFSTADNIVLASAWVLFPLTFAFVTLIAGRILLRLKTPSPSGDQRAIAESLEWLYVVFATKGVIALITIGLFALAFLSPLLLAFF